MKKQHFATIDYRLKTRSHVTLTVADSLERQIATLVDEVEESGEKSVNFNANGLANGEYWYHLVIRGVSKNGESRTYSQKKKLLLVEQKIKDRSYL